jgi:hypothetical protein
VRRIYKSRSPEAQKSSHYSEEKFKKSRSPEVQKSSHYNNKKGRMRNGKVPKFGSLAFDRTSELPDFWTSGLLDFRTSGLPRFHF